MEICAQGDERIEGLGYNLSYLGMGRERIMPTEDYIFLPSVSVCATHIDTVPLEDFKERWQDVNGMTYVVSSTRGNSGITYLARSKLKFYLANALNALDKEASISPHRR
jgi:hypothetical protein